MTKEFRAYVVSLDGHILSRTDLLCLDEEDAKKRARQIVDGCDVELWQGASRIAIFKASYGEPA